MIEKGKKIFLNPEKIYTYNQIVEGVIVNNKKMWAVAQNTWRGFHKLDKEGKGAKDVFITYFLNNRDVIINKLVEIQVEEELDNFENQICKDLRVELEKNIKNELTYNKIRKPVDLYIEHIVAMSKELENERQKLVPMLFIPLDSDILTKCFSECELRSYGLPSSPTFKDVKNAKLYKRIQDDLKIQATQRDKECYRIYLDLLWNDRYLNQGRNLFETNA